MPTAERLEKILNLNKEELLPFLDIIALYRELDSIQLSVLNVDEGNWILEDFYAGFDNALDGLEHYIKLMLKEKEYD